MGDSAFRINRGVTLNPQSAAPSNPTNGDIYYDSALGTFVFYDSGNWINLASRANVAMAADLTSSTFTGVVVQNSIIKMTGSTDTNLHGLTATSDAKTFILYNSSTTGVVIVKYQSATETTAANRIVTHNQGDKTIGVGQAAIFTYDTTQSRWVLLTVSGTGGTGSDILSAIRDMLDDSHLELTAAVIASDAKALALDGSSTAAYNSGHDTYQFSSGGQTIVSAALASQAEFLDLLKPINKVDLAVFWYSGAVDTAATYEVSRNGITNWQAVTMERVGVGTPTYRGFIDLDYEYTTSTPLNIANTGVQVEMDSGAARAKVSQQITLGSATTLSSVGFELKKAGTVSGAYRFAIYGNSAGSPNEADVQWVSPWVDVSTLTTTLTLTTLPVSILLNLAAGTYHLILETDTTYRGIYSAGVNYLAVGRNNTVALNQADNYNGTTWSNQTYDYAGYATGKIYANTTLHTQASDNASVDLNATTAQRLSSAFTVPSNASNIYREITLKIAKSTGTAAGYYKFSIIRDDTSNPGRPSTSGNDVVADSALTAVSSLSTGTNTVTLTPSWMLGAGTYHIVVSTDAAYKSQYTTSAGADKISVRVQSTATPDSRRYNGTDWSNATGSGGFFYILKGISQDLRVRITSSAGSKEVEAFAVTYSEPVAVPVTDVREVQYFDFSGNLGTTDFVIQNFNVNPELVKVHDVYEGKIYNYGVFSTAGNRLIFPAGFFFRFGEQVRLKVEQFDGGSYDNSDQNTRLLAQQHFATPPGSNLTNYGVPGKGFYQIGSDGKTYECVIRIEAGVPVGWDFYLVT